MNRQWEFVHPGYGNPISAEQLKNGDTEFQKQVMKEWFKLRFENPAEQTPYDSSEGGYIYIWGGPYEADDVLRDEFDGMVSNETIQECARELDDEGGCVDWARIPTEKDYDQSLIESSSQNVDFYLSFQAAINNIKAILNCEFGVGLNGILYRMAFVNVISTLEAFLTDAFMNTVLPNSNAVRKLVETSPEFRERKFLMADIFSRYGGLLEEVKEYLIGLPYHNLAKVGEMYKATLDVVFPHRVGDLFKAIQLRHDLVHRNGKRKDGSNISLTKDEVLGLVGLVEKFVIEINDQLPH